METINSGILISIDVGIKHLAVCIMTEPTMSLITPTTLTTTPSTPTPTPRILDWMVLNICSSTPDKRVTTVSSTEVKIKQVCSMCKRVAKYQTPSSVEDTIRFCTAHAQTHPIYVVPCGNMSATKIKKYKLSELVGLLTSKLRDTDVVPRLKREWIEFYESRVFRSLNNGDDDTGTVVENSATEVSLIDVSRLLTVKLRNMLAPFTSNVREVIIENQISPIATRMKSVQSMVTQFFVMECPNASIHYVSASNKLGGDHTDTYAERKKLGVVRCSQQICHLPEWSLFFSKHKKKDDLADCYLQGHWWMSSGRK